MRPDLDRKEGGAFTTTGMSRSAGTVFCYGKVPAAGDFVRYNAQGAGVRALDEWLQRAIYASRFGGGARPPGRAGLANELHLVFSPRDGGQTIAGVLHPSKDRVGRDFPLIVGCVLDPEEVRNDRVAHLPARLAPFLESASGLAKAAAAGEISQSALPACMADLERSGTASTVDSGVDRYLERATFRSMCEQTWGDFEDARKYKVFSNLLDVLLPLTGDLPASYPLGIRFPLPAGGHGIPEQIAFWIKACLILLGSVEIAPTIFWTGSEPGHRESGFALVFLRPPGAKAYAYLTAPEVDSDIICDLETMGQRTGAEAALSIPARIGSMLEDGAVTLGDFLRGLRYGPPYDD